MASADDGGEDAGTRFSAAVAAARARSEVREPDPDARVFLFGPVTLDLIHWTSGREGLKAVSRVERDGREWMTVMVA